MVRAGRLGFAAVGLVIKASTAFVGMTIGVALIVPLPEPADRRSTLPGDWASPASTIVLSMPEGEQAGTVTVVDPTGRELARVTHWDNGDTALVGCGREQAGVSCYLNNKTGAVVVAVKGTSRRTQVVLNPDGTPETSVHDLPAAAKAAEGR